jgi:hypothetical protein
MSLYGFTFFGDQPKLAMMTYGTRYYLDSATMRKSLCNAKLVDVADVHPKPC